MSFLNKEAFDADAFMEGSDDGEDQQIFSNSNNLLKNKVESPKKTQNKTSETTQIQSQSQVYTPAYNQNTQQPQIIKQIDPQVQLLQSQLRPGEAIRTEGTSFLDANHQLATLEQLLGEFIQSLNDLVKNNIEFLYQEQFEQVLTILMRAYDKEENNSLLLLSRNKQTIHGFLNQVEKRVVEDTRDQTKKLKVVRVNSILNNTEAKIMQKFCEALNFKQGANAQYSIEMIEHVQKYFQEEKNICVIFILEDIDFYIEQTKQILLYKILDMLQYCNIPFVFLATSQKVDIVDSFEKRIKSRFSHRQILFYQETYADFEGAVNKLIENEFSFPLEQQHQNLADQKIQTGQNFLKEQSEIDYRRECLQQVVGLIQKPETKHFLQIAFDNGNGYQYLSKYLRIAFSHVHLKLNEKAMVKEASEMLQFYDFHSFVEEKFKEALENVTQLVYQAGEPATVIRNLPRSSLTVLLTARKVSDSASLFNFEAVYQKYRNFMINQSKSTVAALMDMSRQTFLKIFLDLVIQGFLRSESTQDILSVNNKVALGFRGKDFDQMMKNNLNKMDLPQAFQAWAFSNQM